MRYVKKIVDLTSILDPQKTLDKDTRVEDILSLLRIRPWLFFEDNTIVEDLTIHTHIGTHIECSYHQPGIKNRTTIGEVPVDQLVGESLIIDLSFIGGCSTAKEISERQGFATGKFVYEKDLRKFDQLIKKDDIIILRSNLGMLNKPVLTVEAVKWLITKGIKAIGLNENQVYMTRSAHKEIFENGLILIEGLCNLESLDEERVTIIALPLKILGVGGSPCRVIALM